MAKQFKTKMKINGAPVVDADGKLKVAITKTDVRVGSLKNARACAAAVALCRQTGCDAARVHLARTYVKKSGTWTRYFTPPALRAEIIAFDRGGAFEPGEYELKPIQPIVRFGSPARKKYMKEYAKRTPQKRHPQKGARAKPHVVSNVRTRMSAVGE